MSLVGLVVSLIFIPPSATSAGHPTTVFCKIFIWRSKYYLEFYFA